MPWSNPWRTGLRRIQRSASQPFHAKVTLLCAQSKKHMGLGALCFLPDLSLPANCFYSGAFTAPLID
eukprot:scaffold332_cov117-Cylindrotheca_fusiformis.AAC.26